MTANDSDVSDGDTLTGSQVVRVYGENLTAPFVTLTFGGVEYPPLYQGEDYAEFFIGDNGTAIIAVDGNRFMSFGVEGVAIPANLNGHVIARQAAESGAATGENQESTFDGCMEYSFMATQELPWYRLEIFCAEGSTDIFNDLTLINCTNGYRFWSEQSHKLVLFVTPTDFTKPVYIIYEEFIFFVSNYVTD